MQNALKTVFFLTKSSQSPLLSFSQLPLSFYGHFSFTSLYAKVFQPSVPPAILLKEKDYIADLLRHLSKHTLLPRLLLSHTRIFLPAPFLVIIVEVFFTSGFFSFNYYIQFSL